MSRDCDPINFSASVDEIVKESVSESSFWIIVSLVVLVEYELRICSLKSESDFEVASSFLLSLEPHETRIENISIKIT